MAGELHLVGRTVDIKFARADIDDARERVVLAVEGPMLICRAPDGVIEWLPLASIVVIADHATPAGEAHVRTYFAS